MRRIRIARLMSVGVWVGLNLLGLFPAASVVAQENFLTNPDFEAGFHNQGGTSEVSVADNWTAWWVQGRTGQVNQGYLVRPEYQAADTSVHDGRRVHGGEYAQKLFSSFATHDAGLLQTVTVPAESSVQFSAWVQTWSTGLDDPDQVVEPGNYGVSIGIDPTGGTNPTSSAVVWTPPTTANNNWIQLSITAQTTDGRVTVFTRGAPQYRVKHNDSYWDDLSLILVEDVPPPADDESPPPDTSPAESDAVYHIVQPGENLFRISLRYDTTVAVLMALNNIYDPDTIYLGQQLLVRPASTPAAPAPAEPAPVTTYIVQFGDTLGTIAAYYGTTVEALAAMNNIVNPELIYVGQSLTIGGGAPVPVPAPTPSQPTVHVVQPGEMLSFIAANYGVTMWAIADANNLSNVDYIWVGQELIIPTN